MGGDALAVSVCEELLVTQGHRVALLWMHDHELSAKLDRLGCDFVAHSPSDYDALRAAGVMEAASIMALSDDDRLNLQVALKARDLNPSIRVVLRQFNRTLGRKLEQNLPDCSVLSLSAHSAATFAASALDQSCFFALQFPDLDGVQAGFAERTADEFGVAGLTVELAQQRLRARVVAIDGTVTFLPGRVLQADERIVVFARVDRLDATSRTRALVRTERRRDRLRRLRVGMRKQLHRLRTADSILLRIIAGALTIVTAAIVYFAFALGLDPVTAFYFVATTFTSTGYGDITPLGHGALSMILANVVMFTGVAAIGLFIAFVTSALTRAQVTALHGLRQIRTRGHVLVCGAGNVGTRVIQYLLELNQRIVVVEPTPSPALLEMSRAHRIELLSGDATSDATLDLCNIAYSRAVVAVTDSDTANLEVALGVRARNPEIAIVMRAQDGAFAASIGRQFDAIETFSTTTLAAPAFAMLSRFPGTRGRIAFGDDTYNVGERLQGEVPAPPPADNCIPLAVWRRSEFVHIDVFEEMQPFDRLLFLVPLSQFKPAHPSSAGEVIVVRT